jgi:hypothetical protein
LTARSLITTVGCCTRASDTCYGAWGVFNFFRTTAAVKYYVTVITINITTRWIRIATIVHNASVCSTCHRIRIYLQMIRAANTGRKITAQIINVATRAKTCSCVDRSGRGTGWA